MVVVDVESSLESSGRGGGGAVGKGEQSSSPSSISSSYIERSDRDGDSGPSSPVHSGEEGSGSQSPVYGGERVINGVAIHLPKRTSDWAFQLAILRELNVSPSQLYLNAWASIQAFAAMCSALGINPSIPILLHHFDAHPLPKRGIMSIPAPRKSNFMSLRNGTSGSPSTNKAPRPTPPPVKVTFAGRSCRPSSGVETLVEPLFEGEVTNAMLELSTRASMLAWYLRDFADRRGAEQVQGELAAEKKISVDLLVKVEDCDVDTLVVFEHEEGFNKALRQASLRLRVVDPYAEGFYIEKDVIGGELVQLEDTPANEEIPIVEEQPAEEEEPADEDNGGVGEE
ncbi:hypothetical protein LR48_Vigan07g177300 [Vigna angularis]|uniref:Uncharacterized protein n=1 Tax=Phaseolus angularis TaxID=3914 RepID=A0A0L9UZW2_PHAAN|nr:hypothetical protein LR48_Vigan07g177300 [Vigna angularis]